MSIQIQEYQKKVNFLESTPYERYDLRNVIRKDQKIIVRQGDLIIINYVITDFQQRGLELAYVPEKGGYRVFAGSHYIIGGNDFTSIIHPEHGIVILPFSQYELQYFTFIDAQD